MGLFLIVMLIAAPLVYLFFWADERKRQEIEERREAATEFEPVARENTKSQNSARWASETLLENAGLFNGAGWFIGFSSESGRAMRWDGGDGHACLVAPTGSGKGTCIQLVNMLWGFDAYSVVYRSRLGPVYVLNPYRILQHELKALQAARYNSMSRLDSDDVINFGPLAAKQADALSGRMKSAPKASTGQRTPASSFTG